jgi:hypothetical protein
MDETEVMRQKIQELEAEVKQLKTMLPKEKPSSRSMCPKEVAEKHGGLMKKGVAWEYNHFPFMSYKDLMSLSSLIRRCCFLRVKLERDTAKTLKEMTDEEYAKYCEVLDKLLDVFQEYGCCLNDNY